MARVGNSDLLLNSSDTGPTLESFKQAFADRQLAQIESQLGIDLPEPPAPPAPSFANDLLPVTPSQLDWQLEAGEQADDVLSLTLPNSGLQGAAFGSFSGPIGRQADDHLVNG